MTEKTKNTGSKGKKIALFAGLGALIAAAAAGLVIFFATKGKGPENGSTAEASATERSEEVTKEPESETEPVVTGVWHCICGAADERHLPGCDGSEYRWTAWTEGNALPVESGYWYLDTDVELLTSENVANVTSSAIIYLDLNGHTVHSATRVYRAGNSGTNVDLTFLDSAGSGKVVMDTHPNGATLVLLDGSGAKSLTFYGGTYDGSALSAVGDDGQTLQNGTLIRVGTGAFNIHGGTFIGGRDANAGGIAYVQNAEFHMTGGELRDGGARNAGNVMIRTSVFEMTGGVIRGGTATGATNSRGGNIFSDKGTIRLSGSAEVLDGKASYLGDNVFTNQIEDFTNEATVGFSNREGTGIYPAPLNAEDPNHMVCICGSKTASHLPGCDGTKYAWRPWTDASSLPSGSGKFYLATDVTVVSTTEVTSAAEIFLDLNGHTITATARVYQMASSKIDDTLTVLDSAGGARVLLRSAPDGAGFATIGNNGSKLVRIYGGTFDASAVVCSKNGAFMRVGSESSTLAIRGGEIIGGRATNGGSIYVNGGKLIMTGGVIRDGSGENGGNITLNGGSFSMSGGQILRGHALLETGELGRGGNIFNNNGVLNVAGSAKIADGTAVGNGPNIFSKGDRYQTNVAEGAATLTAGGDGIYPFEIAPEDENHKVCICGSSTDVHLPGCDGTKDAWRPWTVTDALPVESGKYYLAGDVTVATTLNVTSAAEIYLDLNGHTVTSSTRIYQFASAKINDSLTLLDSAGNGKVVLNTYAEGASFAAIGNTGNKVITIYGGTYDMSAITTSKNGGFLRVGSATSTLNFHGGEIIGGTAENGGAVHVNGGKLIMTGGVIREGSAKNGGNLMATNGGTIEITGGEVKGGSATLTTGELGRGGNIFINESILTIGEGAKVYDGTSVGNGPNVFFLGECTSGIAEGTCFFTEKEGDGIYPLTVEPEPEPEAGDDPLNRCICGSTTDAHLPGCDGTKHLFTALKADTAIPGEAGTYYFALDEDLTFDFTISIDTNSTIHLDLNGHTITSTSRLFNLAVADTDVTVTVSDSVGTGKVEMLTYTDGATFAVLGNSGKKVLTIFGGTFDLSAIDAQTTSKNGSFVRASVKGASVPEVNIHGGTIIGGKAQNGGVFYVNGGVLTMTDGVVKDGEAGNAGGNVLIMGGGSFVMTGGELSGGKATGTNGRGGNIFNNGATVTISGDAKVHDGTSVGDGPNVFSTGEYTLNVTAGTCYFTDAEGDGIYPPTAEPEPEQDQGRCICGSATETHLPGCDGAKQTWTSWTTNNALPVETGYYRLDTDVTISTTQTVTVNGSAVYLDLNGHKVTSNTRIYNLATKDVAVELVISDGAGSGEVVMTTYAAGGTFAVLGNTGNKTLTIYGGTFDASAINATGGNGGFSRIAKSGSFTSVINLHGGLIKSGTASNSKYAGGIYVASGCTLNITGGEITGGSGTHGSNVYATGSTVHMTGGKITNGHASAIGGNVFLIDNASLLMEGGEIYGGTTDDGAGNVCVNKASMIMSGGKIYGGTSQTGGNIRVQSGGTITMTGGEIYGGSATVGSNPRGGNILNNASTVTISGAAKVYDGTATNGGANIYNIGTYTLDVDNGCVFLTDSAETGIYLPE